MQAERKTRNNRRHLRLSLPLLPLLLSSTLLLSPTSGSPTAPAPPPAPAPAPGQSAPLTFEPCVAMCVRTSECGPDDKNCMCNTSSVFFDSTVRCMYRDCAGCFDSADASFIERVAATCREYGKPVPTPRLREARILADVLARNLKNATTAAAPPPGPTGTAALGRPAPGTYTSETPAPVRQAPGTYTSETPAPGRQAPGTQTSETRAPGTQTSETPAPGRQAPGLPTPGTQTPGASPGATEGSQRPPYGAPHQTNGPIRDMPAGWVAAGPTKTQTHEAARGTQPATTGGPGRANDGGREGGGGSGIVIGGGGLGLGRNATSIIKQSPVPTAERGSSPTPKPDERRLPAEPTDSSPFASPIGSTAQMVTLQELVCWGFAGLTAVMLM
ncbi:hypothetical protein MCOR25_003634 [Pyricularia grisea]|uniref:Extracellular membrane protein CFEM domain-containing protein n=1 Tax=Pyricularia grisea TaxID=148305 RepID=A0A6P8B8Q1_PYRGI|nr:uncharacterized protein PgNI_03256 [Pyricularia grisea]KAI6372668.1 hypothetical protein MCOR25_003634 [Pyricularia grisea]TLD12220.1 hypothetical protein PgNI_03256 [Pyricularia grisea]